MKNLILTVAIILASINPVFASGSFAPKPVVKDVLIQDNASWTGLKYQGLPINVGADAIGTNINYIAQVIIYANANGSSDIHIMTRGFAPSAYSGGLAEFNDHTFIGINSINFQDSGIVMPLNLFITKSNADRTSNWSWQITTVYHTDADTTEFFKNSMDLWIVGKSFLASSSGANYYYYKQ